MKFLIIAEPRDVLFTLPPALVRQLTEASTAVMNKQKKEGKIQEIYWIPGSGTSITLKECNTAEEMEKDFNERPIATYYNHKIYPLADYNQSVKMIIEKLDAVEKMIPKARK